MHVALPKPLLIKMCRPHPSCISSVWLLKIRVVLGGIIDVVPCNTSSFQWTYRRSEECSIKATLVIAHVWNLTLFRDGIECKTDLSGVRVRFQLRRQDYIKDKSVLLKFTFSKLVMYSFCCSTQERMIDRRYDNPTKPIYVQENVLHQLWNVENANKSIPNLLY